MPREELLGLLNTMTPHDEQRVTAEMQAVSPPADLVIRFKAPAKRIVSARVIVIAASFAVSFGLGLIAAIV